ncbi:hypothetical protein ABZ446_45940 [Streptomyces sp. NPDC005813]|uniref:hypothetical protein n=1 Tax=Streptomyces sp. NPDC005813 TaxID=3155592 RepID=UPI0033F3CAFD
MTQMVEKAFRAASGAGTGTVARKERWVLVANTVAVTVSAVSSVVGMAAPGLLLNGATPGDGAEIYAQAYAVRQLPLTAAFLTALSGRHRRHLVPVLLVSGLVQAGDALIGATSGIPGMAAGGTLAATLHFASAAWLSRHRQPTAALA